MSSIWLRINGSPATEIAAHTPPTWETLADGGSGTASFAFALHSRAQHRDLRPGVLVEILCGPVPVYTGLLTEPDRSTWECHAMGLSASLREVTALDFDGVPTRDLGEATARAMAVGWKGSNPSQIGGLVAGEPGGNPMSVGALWDDYAEQTGQRWGVDGRGRLYMRPDPTTPRWLAAPGTALFVPTSENTPARLAGRFDTGDGYDTAFAGAGLPEEPVDITDRGPMTRIAAEVILAGKLIRTGPTGWANSVTLHREQLTTTGGVPANLATVCGGDMLKAQGLGYVGITRAPWLNVVLGRTLYTAGDKAITVEPVNAAARSPEDVWAA